MPGIFVDSDGMISGWYLPGVFSPSLVKVVSEACTVLRDECPSLWSNGQARITYCSHYSDTLVSFDCLF